MKTTKTQKAILSHLAGRHSTTAGTVSRALDITENKARTALRNMRKAGLLGLTKTTHGSKFHLTRVGAEALNA